jgi:hypothetical protein
LARRSGVGFHGFSRAAPCGDDDAEPQSSEDERLPGGDAVVLESATLVLGIFPVLV